MRTKALTIALVLTGFSVPRVTEGQTSRSDVTARPNPSIKKMVSQVSASNIEATIRKLVSFHTRHTLSETESDARGIGAAREWIKSELERYSRDSGGRLQVEFDQFTQEPGGRIPRAVKIVNVVATLPGLRAESKDRIYVVSGHYDSRVSNVMDTASFSPGANDDASGTAAVMELARVMSKQEFDATLVFMAVAAEEQGLQGATHWAEMAKTRNLNIAGMITNDIVGSSRAADGRVDRTHVRLFAEGVAPAREMSDELRGLVRAGGENDSPARQLARYIKEVGERYVTGMNVTIVYRRDRHLRGGDHSPFLDRGYAAVRLTEPNEDYRHQHQNVRVENGVQYGDLPEFVDFQYVAQVTRVNAAALASLALAPSAPKNVEMEMRLENDTTLRWDANKEPDLAGYQIVWRETTSPVWQHRISVGNATRYTLKRVSKDNYIFGVRAVDKEGNPSPAIHARPAARSQQNR